jgi:hypothetical protein
MKSKWIFILLLPLFFACSPQKRINRIVKRNPELLQVDTITVTDTIRDTISVFTERTYYDTIVKALHDTITIEKDNLTIKYYYDTILKEAYIYGECDTVFLEIPYEKIVELKVPCQSVKVEEKFNWWWLLLLIPVGFLAWYFKKK